jgi:Uma2 family endonuclease
MHHYTYREYLALEEISNVKHEFLDGEIYAMAGGSVTHAGLTVGVSSALYQQLHGACRVFSSDLRIRVLATGLTTYPDASVVCGEPEIDPEDKNTVVNPIVVVEVLSPSTERYDRGVKFQHYQRIATLRAVVFVWQHEQRIEVWSRGADGEWTSQASGPGKIAEIPAIDCTLSVDDVYR